MGSGKSSPTKQGVATIATAGDAAGVGGVGGGGASGTDTPEGGTQVGSTVDAPAAEAVAQKLANQHYTPDAAGAVQLVQEAMAAKEAVHVDLAEWKDTVAPAAAEYLTGLPPDELKKAALAAGFEHPSLAGSSDGGKAGSLAFWLNPGYVSPGALIQKGKIQSAIAAKFDTLSENEKAAVLAQESEWKLQLATQGVQTHSIVSQSDAVLESVTEEEFQNRVTAVKVLANGLLSDIDGGQKTEEVWAEKLEELYQALQGVANATVPGQSAAWLHQQKEIASFSSLFQEQVPHPYGMGKKLVPLLAAASVQVAELHDLPPAGVAALKGQEIAALWDPLVPTHVKAPLMQAAKENAAQIELAMENIASADQVIQKNSASLAELSAVADTLHQGESKWTQVTGSSWLYPSTITNLHGKELPNEWHLLSWKLRNQVDLAVNSMGMKALRSHAIEWGVPTENAKKATKAQLKAYVMAKAMGPLASWTATKKLHWAMQKLGMAETATAPTSTKQAQHAPQVPSKKSYGPPKPAPLTTVGIAFREKMQALAGILHQRSAATKLPVWKGRKGVQELTLHYEGSAQHLGGVHEKHMYRDPSGQKYIFKPDKHSGGAVAAAEEASAELARKAGLPVVEVRKVDLGKRVGSLQPFVPNPQPLASDPVHWAPDQRQGVMLHHVVDWLTGDHDGNPTNFILVDGKTPIRIDRGQSFKFLGSDKLDLDYEPNKHHGAPPHAATLLYRAAREGKVQVDPHTVLPVIQAIENIPDDEYKSILRPVAEGGVQGKTVGWYQAMQQRAAAKKGGGPVTDADVSEAFLDAAMERKNGIRKAFEGFFSTVFGKPFVFGS